MAKAQPAATAGLKPRASEATLFVGQFSTAGTRPYNEDNIDVRRTSKRLIALVADGMGGGEVGASVSDQAIKFAAESLQEARDDINIEAQIRQAFSLAHQSARNFRLMGERYAKSGSTLVCAVLETSSRGMIAHVGNLGDSRVYRVRGKQVTQLSLDHNRYEQMLARGMDESEARKDPQARKLTYCLGTSNDITNAPNLYSHYGLQPGDVLLLCSDGVGEFVNDADIVGVLNTHPAEKAAQKIVEQALVNKSNDNASAVVISYGRRRSQMPLVFIALAALLILAVGLGSWAVSAGASSPTPIGLAVEPSVTPAPTQLQEQVTSTPQAQVTSTFAAPPTWSPTPKFDEEQRTSPAIVQQITAVPPAASPAAPPIAGPAEPSIAPVEPPAAAPPAAAPPPAATQPPAAPPVAAPPTQPPPAAPPPAATQPPAAPPTASPTVAPPPATAQPNTTPTVVPTTCFYDFCF